MIDWERLSRGALIASFGSLVFFASDLFGIGLGILNVYGILEGVSSFVAVRGASARGRVQGPVTVVIMWLVVAVFTLLTRWGLDGVTKESFYAFGPVGLITGSIGARIAHTRNRRSTGGAVTSG